MTSEQPKRIKAPTVKTYSKYYQEYQEHSKEEVDELDKQFITRDSLTDNTPWKQNA